MDSVIHHDGPVADPFEIPKRIAEAGTSPVLFRNPFRTGEDVVSNLLATKGALARCLGVDERELLRHIGRVSAKPSGTYREVGMDVYAGKGRARRPVLPAFQYYRSDAGRYVTSSIVIAKDPETSFVNMSVHRLLALDGNRFAVRMVEGRHLHRIFLKRKKAGEDMPVAVLVGAVPEVIFAACCQLEWGQSEVLMASSLSGGTLPVVSPPGLDFSVPAEAEYMLVGRISREETAPERQVDVLGTLDAQRSQPVVRISRVYCKSDPVFHAILPGGYEHKVLMGTPRAAAVWSALEGAGIEVMDIGMTPGSGGWLHCVISIKKNRATESRDAIMTAFNAHRSLKGVIIVDEDVNPNDYESVDFALATRLRAKGQLMAFHELRGSTLDPSANQETYATMKWGLDLTLGPKDERGRFKRESVA